MFKNLFAISFISQISLQQKMEINGIVVKGLGEGAFFMSMPHYRREIKKKLGFESYPGTLNIKADKIFSFENLNPIRIEGYSSKGKKFGGAACFRAKLKNITGAVIVPDLTRHDKGIMEFIAPVYLRKKLSLKDDDKITIEMLK